MRKAKDIIGLPVITLDAGKRIADVDDILFEPEENRVLALLVDRGGWFDGAKVVPFENVRDIGEDAVVIENAGAIWRAKADPRIKRALDSHKVVSGMDIYTLDGDYVGKVADMGIDEKTGEVKGYEVSGGLVEESLRGKKFLSAPETVEVGEDVLFVPPETGQRIKREVTGGLQKTYEESRGQVEETYGRTREEVTRATTEQQKRYVVGKRAGSAVSAPDGTVIVLRGETISESAADEAERKGVLPELAAAAGGTQAKGAVERLREEASGAFEDVRKTFIDLTGQAQRQTEEQRVKGALGRPVTRVILDRNDHVILNTGEIITHRAIERALQAGVLDILLASVATKEPEFGVEEKKAPRPGEARLKDSERDKW